MLCGALLYFVSAVGIDKRKPPDGGAFGAQLRLEMSPRQCLKATAGNGGVKHTKAMTGQEAEVLAARLTRIWKPISPSHFQIYHCSPEWGIVSDEFGFTFDYAALLSENVEFEYKVDTVLRARRLFTITITRTELGEKTGYLGYHGYHHAFLHNGRNEEESYEEFSAQWMPFFRRGCWLSGCPVEASAYEKAEWMQGFSRKEIDAWNLKI